ncbi:MAG TPA: hypothetical protein VJ180_12845 [Pyrinomonadaceae bacterium]|nr:hypothetical protein [Pyrinomonadaceae bacterium]
MKIKVGVMGSAGDTRGGGASVSPEDQAEALGHALAGESIVLLSGATTGLVYLVGKTAHDQGAFHVGISPANTLQEHTERYQLPSDAYDVLIFTGFGLKGRNVVLVRSCDIVLFIAGGMGSLNEFTIANDEGKIIGCLTQTGGVADEADFLMRTFSRPAGAQVFQDEDPVKLIEKCLRAFGKQRQDHGNFSG